MAFLLLGACLHLARATRKAPGNIPRTSHLALAMMCFSVIAREVDIHKLGPSSIWETIELALRGGILLIWVLISRCVFRNIREFWKLKKALILSPTGVVTAMGILLYLLSRLFDKSMLLDDWVLSRYCEEMIELAATALFFVGALYPIDLEQPEPPQK